MVLDRLKEFIQHLDEKEFYAYVAGIVFAVTVLMAGILYFNYSSVAQLKKRVARLNANRVTTQEILTSFERVKQQRAEVDAILNKDKQFRIVGALNDIINDLGLTQYRSGDIQQSQEPLEYLHEYDEIKIVVAFSGMNMRQLTQLLMEIEKNPRIYTKELDVVKSLSNTSIDVTLTIATLQARIAGSEVE